MFDIRHKIIGFILKKIAGKLLDEANGGRGKKVEGVGELEIYEDDEGNKKLVGDLFPERRKQWRRKKEKNTAI